MSERVGVRKLQRAGRRHRVRNFPADRLARGQGQDRPDALAAREDAVAHRLVDLGGMVPLQREPVLQRLVHRHLGDALEFRNLLLVKFLDLVEAAVNGALSFVQVLLTLVNALEALIQLSAAVLDAFLLTVEFGAQAADLTFGRLGDFKGGIPRGQFDLPRLLSGFREHLFVPDALLPLRPFDLEPVDQVSDHKAQDQGQTRNHNLHGIHIPPRLFGISIVSDVSFIPNLRDDWTDG